MTDERTLERAARSWIEAGPTRAPDRAVEAALLRIQTTPQERDLRVPWRFTLMHPLARLAGAVIAGVLVVGGLVLLARPGSNIGTQTPPPSLPSPSPSPVPSSGPPTLDATFTSARYGYTVRYPAAWTTAYAQTTWLTGDANTWGSGINDELKGRETRFSAASQLLEAGQTTDQWMTAYAGNPSTWPTVMIGGHPGRIDADGFAAGGGTINPGGLMYDAVVVVGRRAYNFNMDGTVDRATFEAFLATVTFDPRSTAAAAKLSEKASSPRHGYTISYPSGWTFTPATGSWAPGSEAPAPPSALLDTFTDPSDPSLTFVVVSQPLGEQTPESWLTAYELSAPQTPSDCWPPPAEMEKVTIDGLPGWIHGGLTTCGFTEAITFARDRADARVYELTAYGPIGSVAIDRTLFDTLLAGVLLTPDTAVD